MSPSGTVVFRRLGGPIMPPVRGPWPASHASHPIPLSVRGDVARILVSCRDRRGRSHVGSADLRMTDGPSLEAFSPAPLLSPGPAGSFDDSGTTGSCLLDVKGETFLYYLGWNLGVTVPFRNSIGVAVLDRRTGLFVRTGRAPILDRSEEDPFTLSYPHVLRDGGRFRMWYGSHTATGPGKDDLRHVIKYAESRDGLSWKRSGVVCIPLAGKDEIAVSRPWVVATAGGYEMYYTRRFRGGKCRLGLAASRDGLRWRRADGRLRLTGAARDWESDSTCYPAVMRSGAGEFLLYNGNDFGRAGFGMARRTR